MHEPIWKPIENIFTDIIFIDISIQGDPNRVDLEFAERGRGGWQRSVHGPGRDAGAAVGRPGRAERQRAFAALQESDVLPRFVPVHADHRVPARQELHRPAESRYASFDSVNFTKCSSYSGVILFNVVLQFTGKR